MTQVFSGACAYELWRDANGYGIAQAIQKEGRRAVIDQDLLHAMMTGGRDPTTGTRLHSGAVVETRQRDSETVFIFGEFANLKASLEATKSLQLITDWVSIRSEERAAPSRDANLRHGIYSELAADEAQVPESCVDWDKIGEALQLQSV